MTYPTLLKLVSSVFCCTRSCYKSSFIFLSLPDSKFQSVVTIWIMFLCFHCHIYIHPYQHSLSHSAYHSFSHSLLFYFILFYLFCQADEAKAQFAHVDGDHLSLLNVYHAYKQVLLLLFTYDTCFILMSSHCHAYALITSSTLFMSNIISSISYIIHSSVVLCCVVLFYSRWWFTIP